MKGGGRFENDLGNKMNWDVGRLKGKPDEEIHTGIWLSCTYIALQV